MEPSRNLPTAREMIPHLVSALAAFNREASVREIEETIAKRLQLTPEELSIPHDRSRTEFQYRLAWSRSYAKKDGLLVSNRRNHWMLPQSLPGA